MISNVVMRESKFSGLRHPTKERQESKIDAAVALIMAMGRALTIEPIENLDDFLSNPIIA